MTTSRRSEPPKLYPFANGTEYQFWDEVNCSRCTKADYVDAGKCELQHALFEAEMDDGSLPESIMVRLGFVVRDGKKILGPLPCCTEIDYAEVTPEEDLVETLPHVIVAGTRTFNDYELLRERMERYTAQLGSLYVVTGEWRGIGIGTAKYIGADLLGERWAAERGFPVKRFPPPFQDFPGKQRNAAFHVRNKEMVEYVAGLEEGFGVVFWDGTSPGTASVIELLRKYRVNHKIVRY